jgi:dihydroxyacetone kinase-like protein
MSELLTPIIEDLNADAGEPLLLFVNGFGGTPLMELYLLYHAAARILAGRSLSIARSLVGSYVTSLEMAGASVTLTRLPERLLALWDAPVLTPALRWS